MTLNALSLSLDKCRGEGYDWASNMIGCLKGLATRVSADFPLALFSYCSGHMLNLVVQDACKESHTLKALDLIRALVNYVKDSPKREASFSSFVKLEEYSNSFGLRPLCSTRWVCREPALKSFVQNYHALSQWFTELRIAGTPSDKILALGYLNSLKKFKTYFTIRLLQKIFSMVHWTHLDIQKPNLNITKCTEKISNLISTIKAESTAKSGSFLYYSCVHECMPIKERGNIISQPEAPSRMESLVFCGKLQEITITIRRESPN